MNSNVAPINNKAYKKIVDAMVDARDRVPSFFMLVCWTEVLDVEIIIKSKEV